MSERRAGDDNNRRRQETSLNGGTGKHKSWEKHAWQNCHGPTLLLENMYHRPTPAPRPSLSVSSSFFRPPTIHPRIFPKIGENPATVIPRIHGTLPPPASRISEAAHGITRFLFQIAYSGRYSCYLSALAGFPWISARGSAESSTEPMADGLPCGSDDYSRSCVDFYEYFRCSLAIVVLIGDRV